MKNDKYLPGLAWVSEGIPYYPDIPFFIGFNQINRRIEIECMRNHISFPPEAFNDFVENINEFHKNFSNLSEVNEAIDYASQLEAKVEKLEAQLQRKTRQARIFYKMYKTQLDAIEFPPTLRETAKRLLLASAKKQLKEEEKL